MLFSYTFFFSTRDHADKALSIMLNVFNEDNFLLASVKKIKGIVNFLMYYPHIFFSLVYNIDAYLILYVQEACVRFNQPPLLYF